MQISAETHQTPESIHEELIGEEAAPADAALSRYRGWVLSAVAMSGALFWAGIGFGLQAMIATQ